MSYDIRPSVSKTIMVFIGNIAIDYIMFNNVLNYE